MDQKQTLPPKTQKAVTLDPKRKLKIIVWVSVFVILIAGIIGSYVWLAKKYNQQRKNLQTSISSLQKEINDLKTKESEETTAEESATTPEETEPTEEPCTPTFTNDEKATMALWKTFTNANYNYSFKYPEDWTLDHNEKDYILFKNNEAELEFSWRSEAMANLGFEGYTEKSTKPIIVSCEQVIRHYLVPEGEPEVGSIHMLYTQIRKNGKTHLIMMSFKYVGASISGDLIDAYDMVLKSVEFK